MDNLPSDWNTYYEKCLTCGDTYHKSHVVECRCNWCLICDGQFVPESPEKENCPECEALVRCPRCDDTYKPDEIGRKGTCEYCDSEQEEET